MNSLTEGAMAIPVCHATFLPGEGHISLVVNHLEKICGFLLHKKWRQK
jgi:hypothetical protein